MALGHKSADATAGSVGDVIGPSQRLQVGAVDLCAAQLQSGGGAVKGVAGGEGNNIFGWIHDIQNVLLLMGLRVEQRGGSRVFVRSMRRGARENYLPSQDYGQIGEVAKGRSVRITESVGQITV